MDVGVRRLILACVCGVLAYLAGAGVAWATNDAGKNTGNPPLPLSEMRVEALSQGKVALFQLYDTAAAKAFYMQLPLTLDLTNFRDAQWMFYPPERLNVSHREAYHDGKKGELSYYAPWGDVFMLYKDFYAGDEMHRLGIGLQGVDDIAAMSGSVVVRKAAAMDNSGGNSMNITIHSNGKRIVFELNDSAASKSLLTQLPLTIAVENYGHNEKIFYPPKKLDTANTPLAGNVPSGTLAYYAPWGDVVMFYGSFHAAPGLYELGHVLSGSEHIGALSGTLRIDKGM